MPCSPLDVAQAQRRVPAWLLPPWESLPLATTQAWSSQKWAAQPAAPSLRPAQGSFLVPRPTTQCPSTLRVTGPTEANLVLASCSQSCPRLQPQTEGFMPALPLAVTSALPPDCCSRLGPPLAFICLCAVPPELLGSVLTSPRGQWGPGRAGLAAVKTGVEQGLARGTRLGYTHPHRPLDSSCLLGQRCSVCE